MLVLADNLVLMIENVEDWKIMIGCFYKIYLKRELRVNVEKSKVIGGRGGEDGVKCNAEIKEEQ